MNNMLTFEKEIKKLEPLLAQDMEESYAYSFLAPLLTAPVEKPVVLYAAGRTCERVYRYLRVKGIEITAVCDRFKRGEFLDSGLTIITPDELYRKYQNAWIVVCTFNYSVDAIKSLCLYGKISEKNILRATYASNTAYFSVDELLRQPQLYQGYQYAYDLACDDTSKQVVLGMLRRNVSGTYRMKKTSSLPEEFLYFDFDFAPKEIFVQAGCYTGDTVEAFIRFRNHNPDDIIYTFEGDGANYAISKKNLEQYKNVSLHFMGLWEKEDTVYFLNNGGDDSRIVSDRLTAEVKTLQVTSLDSFFADKPELPTFIELDVEGAEPQAILGAKNIIRTAKPKLAICVYHDYDHIYRIPQMIQEINPDYKRFRFVQALDNAISDTILFAD